jgi:hypothetical protein
MIPATATQAEPLPSPRDSLYSGSPDHDTSDRDAGRTTAHLAWGPSGPYAAGLVGPYKRPLVQATARRSDRL